MKATILFAAALFAAAGTTARAQGFTPLTADGNGLPALRRSVAIDAERQPRGRVLQLIAARARLDLTFDPALPGLDAPITLRTPASAAAAAILRALEGSALEARVSPDAQVIVVPARAVPRSGAPTGAPAVVRGVVRNGATGLAIPDVQIRLTDRAAMGIATTDADGRFLLRSLAAGEQRVRLARIGYRPESVAVVLVAGDTVRLALTMHAVPVPLAAVHVTPGYFGVLERAPASRAALSRDEIESRPQLGEDVLRAINRLPGLSGTDLSARLTVRGGAPNEVYITLDGTELLAPYHLKDFDAALSIVDVDAVGGIDLSTGGFSAEYGGRLTGVLRMRSVEPRTDRVRTTVGASVTNVRAGSQGGFAGGRGGWLLSARRGYLDLALRLTQQRDSLSPRYHDAFGKVQYDLSPRHRVALHGLLASDRFRYLQRDDPSIASRYASRYGWATWRATFADALTAETVVGVTGLATDRTGWQTDPAGRTLLRLADVRRATVWRGRQDWTLASGDRNVVRWGAELSTARTEYDYVRAIGQLLPGDASPVFELDSTRLTLAPRIPAAGAYATDRLRIGSRLVAEVGVRYDRQRYDSADGQWSPRASLSWTPRSATTVRAAWGLYHQPEQPLERQVEDGLTRSFRAQRAEHRVLGVEQRLPGGYDLRIDAYERRVSRLRPVFVNALNDVELFPEVERDRLRLDAARGDARGVEVLAQRAGRRVTWSASYALARAVDRVGDRTVPRALDQRHTWTVDASYRAPSGRWRTSASWVYHAGWPYTPAYFRVDTVSQQGPALVVNISQRVGTLNAGRLPAYRRLDLRGTRVFGGDRSRVAAFVDVFNVLDAANPRGFGYDLRFDPLRVARLPNEQVGLLPTAGVTWTF